MLPDSAILSPEERLRVAMDAGDLGTWEWSIPTGQVTWSETLERVHGFEQGAFGGTFETYQSFIHEQDRDAVLSAIQRALEEKGSYQVEYRMYKPDGSLHWVAARGRVFVDANGDAHTMSGICMDVSQRRRATEALTLLSEASSVFAASLDYEKTLRSVAQLCVPQLGDWCGIDLLQDGGILHRVAVDATPDADAMLLDELRDWCLADGSAMCGPRHVVRNGTIDFVPEISDDLLQALMDGHSGLRSLRDRGLRSYMSLPLVARGRTIGAMTFANGERRKSHDGRDLQLAEELATRAAVAVDNARLYERAVEASRAKDEFLATLSHELKTPLTSVLGFASLLEKGDLSEDDVRMAIDAIKSSARAQAKLVDDILDVSRAVLGKLRLDVSTVDLVSLVRAATETVAPAARAKSVALEVSSDGHECMVLADPTRLQQVVWNLLSNALKFTPAGGSVSVSISRGVADAEVVVRDTGVGIRPELVPLVFERFRQGERARELGGLGLGLAIVRQLVELHGGMVEVASEGEKGGATFTVRLPLLHVRTPSEHVELTT